DLASDPLKRPSAQYVLMRNAWELSAKAGDVDRAMTMIDQAAELYAMNPLDAKVDVVKTAERSARAGSDAEAALPQLLERTESLIGLLLDEDHYAAAVELVEQVGIPVAGRIDDGRQVAEWIERRTEFRNLQEEYAPVARARESLQADPSDAAANLTVGRWLCLVKGHWPEGLQYLALGGNEPLARLAARDLEGPSGAEQQIELADGWWNLSQHAEFRQKPPVAASLQARATLWYHEALPSVSGPLRERAEKRLGISGTAEPEGGKQALAFDGRHSHAVVNFGYAGTCAITLEVIARPERMEGAGSAISNYDPDRRSGLTLGTMGGVSWFFSFLEASPHPRQPALTIGTPIRAVARPTPGGTGWCHVAAVFDGKEIRLYVDGQLRDSKAIGGPHRPTTKLPLIIGASPARVAASGLVVDSHYKGLLKAVRISDIARYTQDFSPPAQLAREDNHTQLLLLFDKETGETVPDSATGKTSAPGSKRAPASFARLFGTQWVDAQGDNASSQQPPNNGGR
ncbi:MAG: LamG domain-containing protein, partial [Thermoguttaceae bacterium]|nr:LamG domain-containing protein [Thermoguttaceae bacterium]